MRQQIHNLFDLLKPHELDSECERNIGRTRGRPVPGNRPAERGAAVNERALADAHGRHAHFHTARRLG
jgi:hypothetical protein